MQENGNFSIIKRTIGKGISRNCLKIPETTIHNQTYRQRGGRHDWRNTKTYKRVRNNKAPGPGGGILIELIKHSPLQVMKMIVRNHMIPYQDKI